MKKMLLLLLLIISVVVRPAVADEGMWLVHLLGEQVYADMVKKGLKLSKDQLYSVNKASIKDAIVIFGGGCTGEIVSKKGLIFTNHHCGYDAIADVSTVENNYLRDGFWAKSIDQEIPAKGLSVQFLVRIEDVSAQVEAAIAGMSGIERVQKQQAVFGDIIKAATENNGLEARIVPMFRGNQFLMFVYERFPDVRLVGTPPESIGKFGGDTDNWEWPRHTGDFAVFRVYANKENKPAAYSPENVPYTPKYSLPISTKGFKEGDFAMIYGYPGSTNRYESSFGVKLKTDIENPAIVGLRDIRLKLMFEQMKKSDATRLKLASAYASISNYWKFFDGEAKQLLKYKVFEQKQAEERAFQAWAQGKPDYENILAQLEKVYAEWAPFTKHNIYLREGILASSVIQIAAQMQALERALMKATPNPDEIAKVAASASDTRKKILQQTDLLADENILAAMTERFYNDIAREQHPKGFFDNLAARYGDLSKSETFRRYAADVFSQSFITDDARWEIFIASPDTAKLLNDPAYRHMASFVKNYNGRFSSYAQQFQLANGDLGRMYMKGIMQMDPKKVRYPDANFTMRTSYGQVKSYRPRDAVFYSYICTLTGVMEKYKPGDYEFDLPPKLIELYQKRDFGPYIDKRANDLVVAFITTNDITGGNSGSPVLNGKGELIGLAFDGNYEALSHKIAFDKDLNRTINVDVRYVLWCIDKLGGASNVIAELDLR
jgi:hypothetical protein